MGIYRLYRDYEELVFLMWNWDWDLSWDDPTVGPTFQVEIQQLLHFHLGRFHGHRRTRQLETSKRRRVEMNCPFYK